MDSVAANTLNYYSLGSRIFGVNATTFLLFPTLSRFGVIDVGVAAADVVEDAVAVATVVDSAVESRP